jgi:chloramphenicol-sensitive protein RarD
MARAMSAPQPSDDRLAAREKAVGLGYGVLAYASWGLSPMFWKMLAGLPALELVAQRTVWGLITFASLAFWRGQAGAIRTALRTPRIMRTLVLTSLLLSSNWLIFIYATINNHVIEASLGYFMNPLASMFLGMLLLGERLRRVRWLAVGLAAAGVLVLAVRTTGVPWIPLFLATSFALYGYLRKTVAVEALPGSTLETLCVSPLGIGYLVWLGSSGHLGRVDVTTHLLLVATGAITALPLLWFAHAARRLTLTTLGFLSYSSPSIQFVLAVTVWGEPFTPAHQQSFACIWAGLLVFSLDSWYQARSRRRMLRAARAARPDSTGEAPSEPGL